MAERALRVIAVASKKISTMPSNEEMKFLEDGLDFVGLIGMIDPPGEGVKDAVKNM